MKTKSIFIPILLLFLPMFSHSQAWKWAKKIGSANTHTNLQSMRPYSGTHVLLSGSFAASTLSLGSHTVNNAGQDDGFVAIADEAGEYLWAAKIGGSGQDFIMDAAVAPNGDFAVVGNFNSLSLTIGSTNLSNSGETDAFIVKYHADKTIAWAKKIGSADIDKVDKVVMDSDGNTYVSGYVQDKFTYATLFVFVRKLDAAGNQLWERKGEMANGYPQSRLAMDDEQNIYLSGSVYGIVTFGSTSLSSSDTSYAAFIVKYNPSGTLQDTYINTTIEKFNGLEVSGNHVYVCGDRLINNCFGWGWPLAQSKIHVLKLDNSLNVVWHKSAGGEGMCQSYDIAKGLSIDDGGNVYVAGYFFSDVLQFAGYSLPNTFNLDYYYPEIFVFKYSPNGLELWGKSLGGIHLDEATCIHAVGDDQFFLGGNFESNPAGFGGYNLHNTGTLDSIYVHLMPARYGRKPMGFLTFFDVNASSIHPEPAFEEITIFPNPANGQITIQLKSAANSPLTFQLYSAEGRLLRQTIYSERLIEIQEDLGGLTPGLYLVTLYTEQGFYAAKVVKD
jgi:Secretion system C-terminal sorting domain